MHKSYTYGYNIAHPLCGINGGTSIPACGKPAILASKYMPKDNEGYTDKILLICNQHAQESFFVDSTIWQLLRYL